MSLTYDNPNSSIEGFADAGWAQYQIERESYIGYVLKLCHGRVSWEAKKRFCVLLSSNEAEYVDFL